MSDSKIDDGDAAPSRVLPQVRLVTPDGPSGIIRILPGQGMIADAFEPFDAPLLPKSVGDWAALLCERFWIEHERCLAVLLLLDVGSRAWGAAVPAQRCGRDAACWSAARSDFADFPASGIVAGSFQSRCLASGEEAADAVPPADGLHLVMTINLDRSAGRIYSFVRAHERTDLVLANRIVTDDVQVAIAQAMPRLVLL